MSKEGIRFVYIVLVLSLIYQNALTSFVSTPQTITPTKTQELTLSCNPNSEGLGTVLAVHIKKKDDLQPNGDASLSVKEPDRSAPKSSSQDVTESGESNSDEPSEGSIRRYPYNTLRATDPNLFRHKRSAGNSFVTATLMSSNKILIVPQIDRFLAKGEIGDPVHLSVTIKNPDVDDLGLYECQVTHIDDTGSIQIDSETLNVEEAMELSLETLETRVLKLENQIPVFKSIGELLQNAVMEMKKRQQMMEEDVAALKKENMELVKSVADMANEIRSLNAKVDNGNGNHNNYQRDNSNYDSQNSYQGNNQQNNNGYQNHQEGDNGFEPNPRNELRSDELIKVTARMDELENTRIHVLEQQMAELGDRESVIEDRIDETEYNINTTLEDRIKKLEAVNWEGIAGSFQRLELETIPIFFKNLTVAKYNISLLQRAVDSLMDRKELKDDEVTKMLKDFPSSTPNTTKSPEEEVEASTESVTDTTQEEKETEEEEEEKEEKELEEEEKLEEEKIKDGSQTTMAPIKGHACYVCGNNQTQTHCTATTVKTIEACPDDKTNCITDLYQDGHFRHIYKRCASDDECKNKMPKSAKACEKDSFITPTAMECHFCCTTAICNDYIRPSRSIYHLD